MTEPGRPPFDLDAYLARIGFEGDLRPTRDVLDRLHLAHATQIPFENLDILLDRPILLGLDALQAKLVRGRRGGYCFEHNLLFAAALEAVGFPVTRLAARVRWGAESVRPRTHMLLLVEAEGAPYLADVGFGGWGLLGPIPMIRNRVVRQGDWAYRLVEESGASVLQALVGESWDDMYVFDLEPQHAVDYEMASYFVSTYPGSPFLKAPIVQRPTLEARYQLRDRELTITRAGESVARTIGDDGELLSVLAETFGLAFPAGTRFRAPGST